MRLSATSKSHFRPVPRFSTSCLRWAIASRRNNPPAKFLPAVRLVHLSKPRTAELLMKNILHVLFVFAFVLAFTLAIATVGLPAPARSAPSPPPPALAVEEKIDLSGEWSGTQGLRDDFAVKQTGDWVRLEPTCWASATGLIKCRVLNIQFDFVP